MSKTIKQFTVIVGILGGLMAATEAGADFVKMPALGPDSQDLRIKWVRYDGSTNGQMVVVVRNEGTAVREFSADGLFFVPKGDPEKAPQRLGAAGPFQIAEGKRLSDHKDRMKLAPGQFKEVRLEVFCIDSHRSSPSSSTKFVVADQRLPRELRKELKSTNEEIIRRHKRKFNPASKAAIQDNMWKTRDKKWIKVQGERKKEK